MTQLPEEEPEVKAWLLDSKAGDKTTIKLWITADFFKELKAAHPQLSNDYTATPSGGFVRGRPLILKAITIKTCGLGGSKRPRRLYRVIYDGTPFDGTKPRSHGVFSTNPVFFQNHLQKHMNWRCRHLSPFMSATDDTRLIAVIAEFHKVRGRTGIQVLTIDTTGPHWDQQRIWSMAHLTEKFGLRSHAYVFHNEYLIEDSIPSECIIERRSWDMIRHGIDPGSYYQMQQMEKFV